MKKSFLAAAALMTVSAAPPPSYTGAAPAAASGGYPPCSRTVTDRCIQLYERGVNTPANLALNRGSPAPATAMGGPYEPAASSRSAGGDWKPRSSQSDYPPCSRTITDRCIQLYERGVSGAGN